MGLGSGIRANCVQLPQAGSFLSTCCISGSTEDQFWALKGRNFPDSSVSIDQNNVVYQQSQAKHLVLWMQYQAWHQCRIQFLHVLWEENQVWLPGWGHAGQGLGAILVFLSTVKANNILVLCWFCTLELRCHGARCKGAIPDASVLSLGLVISVKMERIPLNGLDILLCASIEAELLVIV